MAMEPDDPTVPAEAMIVSGMAIIVGAALFEWLVISPDHPGFALMSVLASGLLATIIVSLLPTGR